MAFENYVNLYFDDEKIRLTVLTNMCRMLVTRGYMNIKKYSPMLVDGVPVASKRSIVEQPSVNDHIDNSLFLPYIEKYVDNNTYIIPLDSPYMDQRIGKNEKQELKADKKKEKKDGKAGKEKKEKKVDSSEGAEILEFDSMHVVIKIIPQVVKDISNSTILNEFLKTYNKNHKIVVFDGMTDKVFNSLSRKKNIEVFDRDYFMIDLMSVEFAPIGCEIVSSKRIGYILNPKISKMHENDPVARYYNGKRGEYIRIVRPSLNNSAEIAYSKIIEPKPVFK